MTEQTPPVLIVAADQSRLAQLQAAYPAAKAAADAASEALKTITDGIKRELAEAAVNATNVRLSATHGPAMTLTYSESWRVDAKKLKTEDPETYVRFAMKSGSWTLRAVPNGGGAE